MAEIPSDVEGDEDLGDDEVTSDGDKLNEGDVTSDVVVEERDVESVGDEPEEGDKREELVSSEDVAVGLEVNGSGDADPPEADPPVSATDDKGDYQEGSRPSSETGGKEKDSKIGHEADAEASSGVGVVAVPSDAGTDVVEEISATDKSSVSRNDRAVQSTPAVSEALPEASLSVNVYEKNPMVDTLFKTFSAPYYNGESSEVQVTVYLPDNRSVTSVHPGNTNIFEFKKYIAPFVGSEPEKLSVSLTGNSSGDAVGDWTPLIGIPPNSVGGLVLNVSFKYSVRVENTVPFPSGSAYSRILTAREVMVEDALGERKTVKVVTEDIAYVKEWLGGYRDRRTGRTYHDASTETRFWEAKNKTEPILENFCRDAQTHLPYLDRDTQVDANKSTQMWRPDHYVRSVGDKVVVAKPYVEDDRLSVRRDVSDSVVKIQRWYRRLVARRTVREAFARLLRLGKKQREEKNAAEKALTEEKIKYLVGISFPTLRNDFFNLYSVIGRWWKREYNEISKIKSMSERRAAYYDLLQSEIELLSALEKQRIKSKSEAMQRRNLKAVEETSRPVLRHQRKGNTTAVVTLQVQRAREIKEVYMTYIRKDLDGKERIQVLLSLIDVIQTLVEVDRTGDLIALMRREIDLVSMGLSDDCLQGLRKRIEEGILRFVRDKDFNPQVGNFRPIHFPRVEQRSFRCLGCRKLKNPADAPIHVRLKSYKNCRSCDWMQVTAHCVLNIAPYAAILALLRAKEITKCPRNTHCFALQPFGAYYIINNIWHGKSALSETMNLPELRLCRWDNKLEWSPWNTILLTVAEAEVHERIYDNSQVYEDEFVQAVKIKHITTKFSFKVMDETEIYCRETGLWDSAHDENIYQNKDHRREVLQPVDPFFKPPLNKAFVSPEHHRKLGRCSKSNTSL